MRQLRIRLEGSFVTAFGVKDLKTDPEKGRRKVRVQTSEFAFLSCCGPCWGNKTLQVRVIGRQRRVFILFLLKVDTWPR